MARTITQGDSFPQGFELKRVALVDTNAQPLNLTGMTVDVTFRPAAVSMSADPTDSAAIHKATLTCDLNGNVTTATNAVLIGAVTGGLVGVMATSAQTAGWPIATNLYCDVQVTSTAQGLVRTVVFDADANAIIVAEAYTEAIPA